MRKLLKKVWFPFMWGFTMFPVAMAGMWGVVVANALLITIYVVDGLHNKSVDATGND